MTDHDQLLKAFLKEFLRDFFEIFFPQWAARFDFTHVDWLDQEVFPDPPEGTRRLLDLVAKLKTKEPVLDDAGRLSEEWLSLIHVEIESGDTVRPLRRRMHWYYSNLRQRHELPVLPLAVYLNVGLEGLGVDEYREDFGPLDVLRFRYLYVGLPALDGIEYLQRDDEVAAALTSLMRVPDEQLPDAASRVVQCVGASARSEYQKHLLFRLFETYLQFRTPEQEQEYLRLIRHEAFREAQEMVATTFDKGIEKGIERATQRQREMAAAMLVKRFAPLPADVRARLDQLSFDELTNLCLRIIDATSLDDLHLTSN